MSLTSSPRVTMVVPVKDRDHYVRRLFAYLERCGFPYPVVIADDSRPAALAWNRGAVEELRRRGLSVTHQPYPETPMVPKIARALEAVQTPFAVLGADDDFCIPESLGKAVSFLEEHPDYAIAHGEAVVLTVVRQDGVSRVRGLARYAQRDIDSSSGSRRLLYHMQNYTCTWYSVQRADTLCTNWRRTAELGVDLAFSELLASCLSLVQGKMHKGPYLYMVRESNPTGAGAKLPGVFTWLTLPTWGRDYRGVSGALCAELARVEPGETARHARIVEDAICWYLARFFRQFGDPGGALETPVSLVDFCDPGFQYYAEFAPILALCETPAHRNADPGRPEGAG